MSKKLKSHFPKAEPPQKEAVKVPAKTGLPGPTKNYPLRGSLIFVIAHVLLVSFVIVWGFEKNMFSGQGFYFLLYLIELPGIMLTKIIGEAENLDVIAPYAIAFFVNTLFYGVVGYGVGYLFQRMGWIEVTEDIFLSDEELELKRLKLSKRRTVKEV